MIILGIVNQLLIGALVFTIISIVFAVILTALTIEIINDKQTPRD